MDKQQMNGLFVSNGIMNAIDEALSQSLLLE